MTYRGLTDDQIGNIERRREQARQRRQQLKATKGKRQPGYLQANGNWNYGNTHMPDQHVRQWLALMRWHQRGVVLARKLARRLQAITLPMPPDRFLPTGYRLLATTWADFDHTGLVWHRTPRVETDIRQAYRLHEMQVFG